MTLFKHFLFIKKIDPTGIIAITNENLKSNITITVSNSKSKKQVMFALKSRSNFIIFLVSIKQKTRTVRCPKSVAIEAP